MNECFQDNTIHKTTYAPVNVTATSIIFSGRANQILGGLGLGTLDICGPQIALALWLVLFHPQMSLKFLGLTPLVMDFPA